MPLHGRTGEQYAISWPWTEISQPVSGLSELCLYIAVANFLLHETVLFTLFGGCAALVSVCSTTA
jgi:hypothetical protein